MSENGFLYVPIWFSLLGWFAIRQGKLRPYYERLIGYAVVAGFLYTIVLGIYQDLTIAGRIGFAIPLVVGFSVVLVWREGKGYPFPSKEEGRNQLVRLLFVVVFSYGLILNTLDLYTFTFLTTFPFYPVYPSYVPHDFALTLYWSIEVFVLVGILTSIWWYTSRRPRKIGND